MAYASDKVELLSVGPIFVWCGDTEEWGHTVIEPFCKFVIFINFFVS